MPKDLRTYIEYLERTYSDELVRVKREVDASWEVSAVVRKFQSEGKFPAVLFEKVKGSRFPVITNLFASRKRLAATFETSIDKATEEYIRREDNLVKVELEGSGPVKEVIEVGGDVDMSEFPIVTHCEKDAGPYLTPTVCIVKDPDTGIRNAGMYRMMYKGPKKFGISIGEQNHGGHILRKYEKRGKDMEMVVALGHHPAVCHGSQSRVPLDVDELEVMGGLLGEPLKVVKCETVDLEVPSYAEIAIEGRIIAGLREKEAPFGEFSWYYGHERESPVFEVTAVTYRKDAIFHDLHSPYIDHNYCGILGRESALYKKVKNVIPTLKKVRLTEAGCCRFIAYLQIEKEYDGQGKNAALAAIASESHVKIAVVVDEDVDIFSDRDVLWAITTRTQADRHFFSMPEGFTTRINPIAHTIKSREEHGGMDTKLGIDATKPVDVPFAEKTEVKRENWEKINLKDYV